MIIEIKDFPDNVSKVVIEFKNGESCDIITEKNAEQNIVKDNKNKSDSAKPPKEQPKKLLDPNFLEKSDVSNDIVAKPTIPDPKDRNAKVSTDMNNLRI